MDYDLGYFDVQLGGFEPPTELIDSPDRAHAKSRHQGARRAQSALLPVIIRFELLVAAREASEFRHRWRNQGRGKHRI